jgi:predicted O-linked N-acetylglucosamine transferase (SPINDLY family)
VDYIVADDILIPKQDRQYYSEKVAYLPYSHMPHDRKRAISEKVYTREALGLPESGTVFCCFNNTYKITPDVFASWMRILKAVEHSVLWLFSENPIAIENLRKGAREQGVDPHRLIFAKRVAQAEHLARYRVADLFLDTLPYNAHITACDALWAGLPVITCKDRVFVSRIAASVLCAAGLPELATDDRGNYERLAIKLASDPERLRAIRSKLETNRFSTPLFDSLAYTGYIEDAYIQMYQRCRSGMEPDHIFAGRRSGFAVSNVNT